MNDKLVEQWNKVVPENGIVFHLGDFSFNAKTVINLAEKLNGTIILLKGNHDKWKTEHVLKQSKKFQTILEHSFLNIKVNDLELDTKWFYFTLCHYPMESWYKSNFGAVHLHGHTHNTLGHHNFTGNIPKVRIDVGVDSKTRLIESLYYTPFSYLEIKTLLTKVVLENNNVSH